MCKSWRDFADWVEELPSPRISLDEPGVLVIERWAFRGLKDSSYELEPTIERAARPKSGGWAALEKFVASEFKSRARMHLSAPNLPEDELTWLAQMQHYGVPTRLLDFTYSPYVALYFAVQRGCEADCSKSEFIRVWAVDAEAVHERFVQVACSAARAVQQDSEEALAGEEPCRRGAAPGLHPDSFETEGDSFARELRNRHVLLIESLSATGRHRGELARSGSVCVASPPTLNPRLVSQQGVFLLNCSEQLTFRESLEKMMADGDEWYKVLDLPVSLIPEIEERLFQMNIHEQSLFPDLEGLAGLMRQEIRLHWR